MPYLPAFTEPARSLQAEATRSARRRYLERVAELRELTAPLSQLDQDHAALAELGLAIDPDAVGLARERVGSSDTLRPVVRLFTGGHFCCPLQAQHWLDALAGRSLRATQWNGYGANIAPLALRGDGAATLARIRTIVQSMPGAVVVSSSDDYLYAQFTTRLMKYTDDVEFWLDPRAGVVHVRSASRIGEGDFGANRKRIEAIRAQLAAAPG